MKSLNLLLIVFIIFTSLKTVKADDKVNVHAFETTSGKFIKSKKIRDLNFDNAGELNSLDLKSGEVIYNEEIKSYLIKFKRNDTYYKIPNDSDFFNKYKNIKFSTEGGGSEGGG